MPKPTIEIGRLTGDALFSTLLSAVKGRTNVKVDPVGKRGTAVALEQHMIELERAAKLARAAEWQPRALCHIQQIIQCQCGAVHTSFLPGYFLRFESRQTAGRQFRAATSEQANSSLPREVHLQHHQTAVCPQCFQRPISFSGSVQLDLFLQPTATKEHTYASGI